MRSKGPSAEHPVTVSPLGGWLGWLVCAAAIAGWVTPATAADTADAPQAAESQQETRAGLVRVTLEDGSVIVGRVQTEDEEQIEMLTPSGAQLRIPRSGVVSVEAVETPHAPEEGPTTPVRLPAGPRPFTRSDPNHTRLMFAPTGRPLAKGELQFADYYALFPGLAVGLTKNLSLMGGVTVVPGLGLSEQVFYVAPRLAFQTSRRTAFSTGVLFGAGGDDSDRAGAGIAYAVGTFGEPEASFSAGLGYGFITDDGDFERADKPIVMLGGEMQLSNSMALVSEAWLIPDLKASEQPIGLTLRFFGERLSVDLGVILIGEVLQEGFPVPWLSFSYRFGELPRAGHAKRTRASRPLLPRFR